MTLQCGLWFYLFVFFLSIALVFQGLCGSTQYRIVSSMSVKNAFVILMGFVLKLSEKAMAPHSSTLAWKIPWMEEPGGLQSMGSLRVGHTERLHFDFSLSCIGEENGNPLQGSCLENPRDGGAWWAAVSGVAQSRTRQKWLSSSSSSSSSVEAVDGFGSMAILTILILLSVNRGSIFYISSTVFVIVCLFETSHSKIWGDTSL